MASLLSLILGQSASNPGVMPDDLAPQGSDQLDLPVDGVRAPAPEADQQVMPSVAMRPNVQQMFLGNQPAVEEARAANGDTEVPKGLFGIHGKGQNILGILGDALLSHADKAPVYAPWKKKQELAKAMAGFTQNPAAALERMAAIDPEFTAKAWDQYSENESRKAGAEAQRAYKNQMIEKLQMEKTTNFRNRAARLLDGAKSPEELVLIKEMIKNMAARDNIDIDDLGYDIDAVDAKTAKAVGSGDMTVNQQRGLQVREDQGERRLDIAQQNASTAASAAATAAARAARSDSGGGKTTMSDDKRELSKTIASGQASMEDIDRAELLGMKVPSKMKAKARARARGGAPTPATGGKKLIFRNGKLIRE